MGRVITLKYGDKVYKENIEGEMEISELTPDEVKNAANRSVGKYAYYMYVRSRIKAELSRAEQELEMWLADEMNDIRKKSEFAKATIKQIELQVIVDFPEEYRKLKNRVRSLQYASDVSYAIVSAYEKQMSVLQSILAMQRVELSTALGAGPVRGKDILNEE